MPGSSANSPLFPSATPVSHPGVSGELRENRLLRGEHHCRNPLWTSILLPYGTPLSVYSAKTKTQIYVHRLELDFGESVFSSRRHYFLKHHFRLQSTGGKVDNRLILNAVLAKWL